MKHILTRTQLIAIIITSLNYFSFLVQTLGVFIELIAGITATVTTRASTATAVLVHDLFKIFNFEFIFFNCKIRCIQGIHSGRD